MTEEEFEYVVTAYYYRSETYYSFRVKGMSALDDLLTKMDKSGDCSTPTVQILNSAELFGTGREMSY